MVEMYEASVQSRYSIPDEYKQKLIEYISGFKMTITKIEGKFKLEHNRSAEDQSGMLQGLRSCNNSGMLELADFIENIRKQQKS